MSGSHATFAPSSAHRIITCPASLLASKGEPDAPGVDAVQGTVAHYIHEQCLRHGHKVSQYVGMHPRQFMPEDELTDAEWKLLPYSRGLKPDEDFIITDEIANYIDESVVWCKEVPGDRYVEERVDISPWCPTVYALDEEGNLVHDENDNPVEEPQKGTADHFACSPGLLVVTDFKFGTGVQVFAERNYQGILYALGVINEYDWLYDFDKVVIRIAQPRLNHFDVWETTKAELLKIGEYIKERFALADKPNAPFHPDEHACKFCPIAYKCKALADTVLDYFDFEDDAGADDVRLEAEFLTLERSVEIFKRRGLFKLWIGAVEADIATRLSRDPDSVPGLKLVAGRSVRFWPNPDAARDELALYVDEDKLFKPRELLSPAQAEKLLCKADRSIVSVLAEKKPGRPTIVDEKDPRPKWEGTNAVVSMTHFDDESDG